MSASLVNRRDQLLVADVTMHESEARLGAEVEEALFAIQQVIQNRDPESAVAAGEHRGSSPGNPHLP